MNGISWADLDADEQRTIAMLGAGVSTESRPSSFDTPWSRQRLAINACWGHIAQSGHCAGTGAVRRASVRESRRSLIKRCTLMKVNARLTRLVNHTELPEHI